MAVISEINENSTTKLKIFQNQISLNTNSQFFESATISQVLTSRKFIYGTNQLNDICEANNQLGKEISKILLRYFNNQYDDKLGDDIAIRITKRISKLQEQQKKYEELKQTLRNTQFTIMDEIFKQKDETLTKYLKETKLYIVFMGTTSSGKSTFLNALLGQKLLPSSNQNCTKQISYIEHYNINANEQTEIRINGKKFLSLETALKELNTIRDSPNMDKINIKTQSYFHETLSEDLQNRVIFIDTPGIKITDCSDEKYLEQFDKISKQIEELDQYSKRINVWVSDYTTFDRDQEIQKKIISSIKSKVEQNQQQQQNQDNNQMQQSNDESNRLFFILNKFDQRKKTEDRSIEDIQKDIKNVFDSQDIFKISASNALNYNIMNYGTKDAKENFITQFYEDNGENMNQTNQDQTRDHCENNIKNNQNLINNQDFNEFIEKISLQIKTVLNELYNTLLNGPHQIIQYLSEVQTVKQHLDLKQNKITQFWNNFDKKQYVDYNQELQEQQIIFAKSMKFLITNTISEIQNQDPNYVIKIIFIFTIATLDELNEFFFKKTCQSMSKILSDLEIILQLEKITTIMTDIVYKRMEERIQEQKKQFIQKQADELNLKLGLKVNSVFFEKGFKLDMTPNVTFNSIVGGVFKRKIQNSSICKSVVVGSAVVGGVAAYLVGVTSLTPLITSVSISGIASIAISTFDKYSEVNQAKNKLDDWNSSLDSQSQDLVKNYMNIYDDTLRQIRNFME